MKEKIKTAWRIVVILALNAVLLAAVAATTGSSDEASAVISLGANGEDVRMLQEKLGGLGYFSGEADGSYSIETRQAVKSFQEEHGIRATGRADYETLSLLGLDSGDSSGYFGVDVQLLAKFISWKCGGGSYAQKLAAGREIVERMRSNQYPDTLSENLFTPDFEKFSAQVTEIIPDSDSHKAAYKSLAELGMN